MGGRRSDLEADFESCGTLGGVGSHSKNIEDVARSRGAPQGSDELRTHAQQLQL